MWLMTNFGFFSVVKKSDDEQLTVRSRTRGDLDRLRAHYLPQLGPNLAHAGTDYPWRALVDKAALSEAMKRISDDIDYGNFKDEVALTLGRDRAKRYGAVWSALSVLQEDQLESSDAGTHGLPWPVMASTGKAVAYGGVVVDGRGRLLMREVRNQFDDYVWSFAKGRPDSGESPRATALREVREEMGVAAVIIAPIPGDFAGGTSTNRYFLMRADERQVKLDHACAETARLCWAGPDEAARLVALTKNALGRVRDLAVIQAAAACMPPANVDRQIAIRGDWKTRPMPAARTDLPLALAFSHQDMVGIWRGTQPEAMEEKWFAYFEDNVLHLHRSWTGFCVFRVHFEPTVQGWCTTHVEASRHSGQYGQDSDAEDLDLVRMLLAMLIRGERP